MLLAVVLWCFKPNFMFSSHSRDYTDITQELQLFWREEKMLKFLLREVICRYINNRKDEEEKLYSYLSFSPNRQTVQNYDEHFTMHVILSKVFTINVDTLRCYLLLFIGVLVSTLIILWLGKWGAKDLDIFIGYMKIFWFCFLLSGFFGNRLKISR